MESWTITRTSYSSYAKVALVGAGAAASAIVLVKAWKVAYPPRISLEAEILDCIASPRLFTLQELKTATKNFSPTKLLSDTKLGRIYEGKLSSGAIVAVKVLPEGPGSAEEFRREVAVIGCLRHRNIITLVGFCMEESTCALVYPAMPGASLETCLFGKAPATTTRSSRTWRSMISDTDAALEGMAGRVHFPWPERYNVALQIARALVHLHHESSHVVCHRNLRLSNVLLTDKKIVKISDFGLACFQPKVRIEMESNAGSQGGSSTSSNTLGSDGVAALRNPLHKTSAKGSRESGPPAEAGGVGEAPARQEAPGLTAMDDVYSFGIIMLQLVTGRRLNFETDGKRWHLVEWVWESMEKWENWATIVDDRLSTFDRTQVEIVVVVGLHCCHLNTRARPDMVAVLQMMNGDTPVPPFPARAGDDSLTFPNNHGLQLSSSTGDVSFEGWAGSLSEPQQRVFKMPYSRNLMFKGREQSLKAIRGSFDAASLQAPCVSIYGLGGVGKTQLAIEYAYRYRNSYDGVLWVEAADDVESNYAALARPLRLKIPSSLTQKARIAAVRKELEGQRKYLLILDNVNESSFEALRPKVGASHILITTRIHLVYIIPLRLDVMCMEEALEVLKGTDAMCEWAARTDMLGAIAKELGFLPLALAAAGQLLSNGHDPALLLQKVKQDVGLAIEKVPPDYTFRKSSSLSELFEASLAQLDGDHVADGELAHAIFFVGGFFSPEAIPLPLVTVAAQYYLGKEPDSDEDGEMAVMNLVRLSLAVRDKHGDVIFHRLVQAYAVSKANQALARKSVLKTLVRSKCNRKVAPHCQHLFEGYEGPLVRGELPSEEEPLVAVLVHNLAEYYVTFKSSRFEEVFKCLKPITDLGPKRMGKTFFDVIISRLFLLTRKNGNKDHARAFIAKAHENFALVPDMAPLAREALAIYEKQLNWRPAGIEQEQELYAMARSMLKNAERLDKIPLPPFAGAWGSYYFKGRDHGTVGTALEHLGWMFTSLVPDHRFALALYGGADSIFFEEYLPWASGAVGYLYARLEREARLRRLVSLSFALPCGAPARALKEALNLVLSGLAPAFGDASERAEKKAILKRNVAKTNDWIAAGMGSVRSTLVLAVELGELGLALGGQAGKALIRKAIALLDKELPAIEHSCGNDSTEVSTTLYRQAILHRYIGPPNGLRRARQIIESRLWLEEERQFTHRETRFHFLLAQVYLEQGLLKPAHEQLELALPLTHGTDSWRTGKVLELLAAVCWLQGDSSAAMSHITQARQVIEEQRHEDTADLERIRRLIQQWQEEHPSPAAPPPPAESTLASA